MLLCYFTLLLCFIRFCLFQNMKLDYLLAHGVILHAIHYGVHEQYFDKRLIPCESCPWRDQFDRLLNEFFEKQIGDFEELPSLIC